LFLKIKEKNKTNKTETRVEKKEIKKKSKEKRKIKPPCFLLNFLPFFFGWFNLKFETPNIQGFLGCIINQFLFQNQNK